jgi:cyclase
MVQPRAIPALLLKGDGLVKTRRFAEPQYVGDPINAVKLFNDLEADELLFLDITATADRREPAYHRIADIAAEAFMPIAYGGGVSSLHQARRLFQLGIEKVAVTTAADEDPTLISELAAEFGSQAVVGGIDVKRDWLGRLRVCTRSGTHRTRREVVSYARELQERGAGELLLNSIDRDGTYEGYDLELIHSVSAAVTVPVVACGGAGSLAHLGDAVRAGASAAAAGSLFVFTGPHRAVLINYPSATELVAVFADRRQAPPC